MKNIITTSMLILTLCTAMFGYCLSNPYITSNGDIYGYDNDGDGRIETEYVHGYYKSDGTYVRDHYRYSK